MSKQSKRIYNELEQKDLISNREALSILYIYSFRFKEMPHKEDILRNGLMVSLDMSYLRKSHIPYFDAIIHENNNTLATANNNMVYRCLRPCVMENKLLKYVNESKSSMIFQVEPISPRLYFTEQNDSINVLIYNYSRHELQILDLNTFVNTKWDDYFDKTILNIMYQWHKN